MLSSASPSESQNLGVVWGTSDTAPLHNHCLIFVQHLFKGKHDPGAQEPGQRKGLWWHSSLLLSSHLGLKLVLSTLLLQSYSGPQDNL